MNFTTTEKGDGQWPPSSAPSHKRRRVAIACNSCRRRKTRCDGVRPGCSHCVGLGFHCAYQGQSNDGDYAPEDDYGGRIQALEGIIANLLHGKQISSPLEGSLLRENHLPLTDEAEHAYEPRNSTSETDFITLDDNLFSNYGSSVDGMGTLADLEEQNARTFGPSSTIALLQQTLMAASNMLNLFVPAHRGNHESNQQARVSKGPLPTLSPGTRGTSSAHRVNLLYMPDNAHAIALFKDFFADTAKLFPFVYEGDVLRLYAVVKQRRLTEKHRSCLALINAIFAIATYISAHPDRLADTNAIESKVFFDRAEGLLQDVEPRFTCLETVQAQLLMVQYCQGTQEFERTWRLNSSAVRTAVQLGLHSDLAGARFGPLQREVRKRTWFACFMIDGGLSVALGCYPSVSNEQLCLDLPVDHSLEALDKSTEVSTTSASTVPEISDDIYLFTSTIKLFRIQADILKHLYNSNLDIHFSQPMFKMLKHIVVFEQKLEEWRQDLPPKLTEGPWSELARVSPSAGSHDPTITRFNAIIKLRSLNIRLLLHRPVVADLVKRTLAPPVCTPLSSSESLFISMGCQCLSVTEECATEIVEILCRVDPTPVPWWIAAYYAFTAALIIFNCAFVRLNGPFWSRNCGESSSETSKTFHTQNLGAVLLRATDVLRRIERGTQRVEQLRKTAQRLVQLISFPGSAQSSSSFSIIDATRGTDNEHSSTQEIVERGQNPGNNDLDLGRGDFAESTVVLPERDSYLDGADLLSLPDDSELDLFGNFDSWGSPSLMYFPG